MPATGESGGVWELLPSFILTATEQLSVNSCHQSKGPEGSQTLVLWLLGRPTTAWLPSFEVPCQQYHTAQPFPIHEGNASPFQFSRAPQPGNKVYTASQQTPKYENEKNMLHVGRFLGSSSVFLAGKIIFVSIWHVGMRLLQNAWALRLTSWEEHPPAGCASQALPAANSSWQGFKSGGCVW